MGIQASTPVGQIRIAKANKHQEYKWSLHVDVDGTGILAAIGTPPPTIVGTRIHANTILAAVWKRHGERGIKPRTPSNALFCEFPRAVREKGQEKKTPFRSRPKTEIRFALGSGGVSDSNRKPDCSADQLIVAPVLKKLPLKFCELFSI